MVAASSMMVVQTLPLVQISPSTRLGKDYNEGGISHQEPCGKAVFGPLNRPSLMSLARKDGNTVLRLHTLLCGSQGGLLHAILVDGMIEKIEGRPELADAARSEEHTSELQSLRHLV